MFLQSYTPSIRINIREGSGFINAVTISKDGRFEKKAILYKECLVGTLNVYKICYCFRSTTTVQSFFLFSANIRAIYVFPLPHKICTIIERNEMLRLFFNVHEEVNHFKMSWACIHTQAMRCLFVSSWFKLGWT